MLGEKNSYEENIDKIVEDVTKIIRKNNLNKYLTRDLGKTKLAYEYSPYLPKEAYYDSAIVGEKSDIDLKMENLLNFKWALKDIKKELEKRYDSNFLDINAIISDITLLNQYILDVKSEAIEKEVNKEEMDMEL